MFSRADHRVPLGASDDSAALDERLQFTVGEGPCRSVHDQDRAVLATKADIAQRWPAFHGELITRTPYRSIISLPVQRGLGGAAAVDLYFTDAQPQTALAVLVDVWAAVDTVGELMTLDPMPPHGEAKRPAWLDGIPARGRVQVMDRQRSACSMSRSS